MSIYLIRHGETALNAARVLQPADTPLNDRGTGQAQALARRLRTAGIGRILSSDLPRALATAEAIGAVTGAPLTTTPLLQERNFGALRGRPYDSLTVDPIASEAAPPGGESIAAFENRVLQAWSGIVALAEASSGHLAVVTHGLVIKALLAGIVEPNRLPLHVGNASLSILERIGAPGAAGRSNPRPLWAAAVINCTRHLAAADSDDPDALSGG